MRRAGLSIGLVVISVLAAFVGSASAAPAPAKWINEGAALAGAESIDGMGTATIATSFKKQRYDVKCNVHLPGTITQLDQMEGTLTFAACQGFRIVGEEVAPSGCSFQVAPAQFKGQLVSIGIISYVLMVPKAGEVLTTITVGECAPNLNGAYMVKGNTCAQGPPLGVEAVEQAITWSEFALNQCTMEGAKYMGVTAISKITVGGEPALFSGEVKAKMNGKRIGQKFGAE
jgi:hypothetical protein